jgi:hypothetical protein
MMRIEIYSRQPDAAHVVFYDNRTALVFSGDSGDFLMPGRLLVDDAATFHQSALRLIDFLQTRPVSHILGGHIELDAHGETIGSGLNTIPMSVPLRCPRKICWYCLRPLSTSTDFTRATRTSFYSIRAEFLWRKQPGCFRS